jgi:hypothetical protein
MRKAFLVLTFFLMASSLMAADFNFRVRRHLERAPETFVFVSDVQFTACHPSNLPGERAVVNAIIEYRPSFILNGGDFVEDKPAHDSVCIANTGWDNPDWTGSDDFKLFESTWSPIINLLGKNNLYGVPGNHDFWTDATWAFAHKDYYLVRSGIFFLMLNVTGSSDSTTPTWDVAWAEQVLASSEAQGADFRIVIFHEPGDTNRNGGWGVSPMAKTIASELFPLFRQYGVDLVLNGHIHTYRRWLGNNGITYVISGGGGGGFQGDAGDTVNAANYHNFIEFTKSFSRTNGGWKLNAKVVGIDMTNSDEPMSYQLDSFDLESLNR